VASGGGSTPAARGLHSAEASDSFPLMLKKGVLLAVFLALLPLLAGCGAVRRGADLGHRIIDRNGLPPAKLTGLAGAGVGYAAGLPLAVLLLPTYPFERLQYPSGPDHDLPMPILFAPVEIGGGLGALIAGGPFQLMHWALWRRGVEGGEVGERGGGLSEGGRAPSSSRGAALTGAAGR
jgi:hypothetical protein